MTVSVSGVLTMPAVMQAEPAVLAGAAGLGRAVRWVHTSELPDIAELLREGDLVLTTGIALPDSPAGLARFASTLADSGAAGVFLELGRRWDEMPAALVEACDAVGLPLVALQREVRFAAVAQSIGEQIVDHQLTELREAQQVHDTFTALSIAEAGPRDILSAVASSAGGTAVLETEERRILDYVAGAGGVGAFLEDWQRRSSAVRPQARTAWDRSNGWLVARIGKVERGWGRLVIDVPTAPSQRLIAVAERGAAALAMHLLHDRQRIGRERQLHHELLVALLTDAAAPEMQQRCHVAGLPTTNRHFVALALRAHDEQNLRAGAVDEVVAALVHAGTTRGVPALVASVGGLVRVLVSLPRSTDAAGVIDDLVGGLPHHLMFVAAAGSPVEDLTSVDRTLRESRQVLDSLGPTAAPARVHRLADTHVRGLLALLGHDDRLATFSARELHALREADSRQGGRLEGALRALLEHPGSKTAAAAALAVSRPVLYERLATVERVLGVDLDDGEVRTSLQLALLIADRQAAEEASGA